MSLLKLAVYWVPLNTSGTDSMTVAPSRSSSTPGVYAEAELTAMVAERAVCALVVSWNEPATSTAGGDLVTVSL
jgi:hypothetical protein